MLLKGFYSGVGILGIWSDRNDSTVDTSYSETLFIMLNDIEILMYTIGASLPGLYNVENILIKHKEADIC